jgi:hypothetical protein
MSTLKVTNIAGLSGSSTDVMQGLAKAWGAVDQDTTGHPIYDSYNLSSTTDEGTGYTICAYSNAMANVNYGITTAGQAQDEGGSNSNVYGKSTTVAARTTATGSFCFDNRTPSGGQQDLKYCAYAIHGDLA